MTDDPQAPSSEFPDQDELICNCFSIHKSTICRAVRENNFKGIEQITRYCSAGSGCQSCHQQIRQLIDITRAQYSLDKIEQEKYQAETPEHPPLNSLKNIRKINESMDNLIIPHLKKINLNLELVDILADTILVKITPTHQDPQPHLDYIQHRLEEKLSQPLTVKLANN
ncbi:MAG: (2Fe-2S)-binding protein [Planctomycetes bacterium]|nr:(2Fe-2S)-binding protein [Planctomycetota bacterium]